MSDSIDRAAVVRAAFRELVAERGFHGASMGAVAKRAGVATGTAYVHYASKHELIMASYLEAKFRLGRAATGNVDPTATAREQFAMMWDGARQHLESELVSAAFLVQFESSPFAAEGHERASQVADDPLRALASGRTFESQLARLPRPLLYDLALGSLLRAVGTGIRLDDETAAHLRTAAWRAITVS